MRAKSGLSLMDLFRQSVYITYSKVSEFQVQLHAKLMLPEPGTCTTIVSGSAKILERLKL